jgi:glycosyltransferase involved in cell wall biosynthesis
LADSGYEVFFVAGASEEASSAKTAHVVDGVRIVGFPPVRGFLQRILNLPRIFKIVFNTKADAYHFHDPDLLPVGVLLRWLRRKPVIYDVHEPYPEMLRTNKAIPKRLRKPVSRIFRVIEDMCSRSIGNVIVVNELVCQRFQQRGCNVEIVSNTALLDGFEDAPERAQNRAVISIGTLSTNRGSLLIPKIVRAVRNQDQSIRFLIVDRAFRARQRELFLDAVKKHGVEDAIELLPNTVVSNLPSYLSQATIGLSLLTLDEVAIRQNITKLYEYMAAGLPIIASDVPNQRRDLEESESGLLVTHDSPDEYAEAIIRLMNDQDTLDRFSRNGRSAFMTKFNWEIDKRRLLGFYETLLGS